MPEERRKTKSGWEYDFEVEAGLLGASGDDEHVLFQRYKDLDDGLYLRRFDFTADRASDGAFVSLLGGGAGYDDQYYALTVGKHNSWQARAFFNESPAVFTTNFRSRWKGEGTGLLTLNGLTPGGLATANATQAALRNALATTPQSTVALTRSKAGLSPPRLIVPRARTVPVCFVTVQVAGCNGRTQRITNSTLSPSMNEFAGRAVVIWKSLGSSASASNDGTRVSAAAHRNRHAPRLDMQLALIHI